MLGERGDPEIETFSLGREKIELKEALRERGVGTKEDCAQELREGYGGRERGMADGTCRGQRTESMEF